MEQQREEKDARWLLAGSNVSAPKGWIALSDFVRGLFLGSMSQLRLDGPFDQFAPDVPSEGGISGRFFAAAWAILVKCPSQAILLANGETRLLSGLLRPPPPGRLHESANETVTLTIGTFGSGTVFQGALKELVGQPVLVRLDQVRSAAAALGLDEILSDDIDPNDTPRNAPGRPSQEAAIVGIFKRLHPNGCRPTWKVLLREINAELTEEVSESTLQRHVKKVLTILP